VCESEPHDRGAHLRAEGAGHEAERLAVVDPGRARAGRDGVTLSAPITFLVGENGSGKSTIVEAVEEGWGVDVRGGQSGRKYSSELEKSVLGASIRLDRGRDGSAMVKTRAKGFFLRSETALDVFQRLDYGESYGDSLFSGGSGRFSGLPTTDARLLAIRTVPTSPATAEPPE
jgi:hypothetical protein